MIPRQMDVSKCHRVFFADVEEASAFIKQRQLNLQNKAAHANPLLAPKSKSEGNEKPQKESEARSR